GGGEVEVIDGQVGIAGQPARAAVALGRHGRLGHDLAELRVAVLAGPGQDLGAGDQGAADERDLLAGQQRRLMGLPDHRAASCPLCRAQPLVPWARVACSPAWRAVPGAAAVAWWEMIAFRSPSANRPAVAACPSARSTAAAPCRAAS